MPTVLSLILYIASFVSIWFGAGLILKTVEKISHKIRASSFAVAFFILGLLTSIPETAVSINAVLDHSPEIFVGTLIGGTIVIFLLIIPLLAIFGNGVSIDHNLDKKNLIKLLAVISAPGLTVIDQKVTNFEGILLIFSYILIFYLIQRKHGVLEKKEMETFTKKSYSFTDLASVAIGVGIVLISSQYIVHQTLTFAQMFNVSAFYISIIFLSIGTNLPELSLALRAVLSGKKTIAFGDYLGSAAANTILFGVFTLANDGESFTINGFTVTFLFLILGLLLFYYFSQSKRNISRKEGYILLLVYILFVAYQVSKGLTYR